jgi:hypothetical protein
MRCIRYLTIKGAIREAMFLKKKKKKEEEEEEKENSKLLGKLDDCRMP